ncbi:MAG: FAD-dependent oxidoreductase [Saprospiraceae bacterium]|nr:FAD-dependent oxidoreductase [Saprospiraceae bacterium]
MKQFDVIIIGGGPMGLATAAELSKSDKNILLIEQYSFVNQKGSSAGMSRQFRIQYAQDYMALLAKKSIPYWDELQKSSKETLIDKVGSLWFGDPKLDSQEGGIKAAMDVMDELNIDYEPLKANQIEERFPFKSLPEDYTGFFQKDGGIINFEATQKALLSICVKASNVTLLDNSPATNIESLVDGSIIVSCDKEQFTSEKLVLCPGAYINELLKHFDLSINIDIWEMSSAYYKKTEDIKLPTWFVFQEPQDTSLFYGFPEVDWAHPGYIRVAPDIPDRIIQDPSQRTFSPSEKSLRLNETWVIDRMKGLSPESKFTATCLITLSNNSKELLLDYLPDSVNNNENIIVYTGGWAAKFVPLLGKIISDLVLTNSTEFDISHFQIDYIPPMVNYSVDIHPNKLEMTVTMEIPQKILDNSENEILIEIPTWVPGSYDFEPFGRDIFSVVATDENGNNLVVKRNGFNGYIIEGNGHGAIVNYQASCYEPDLGDVMGLVDSDYAVLMGTRYLFLKDYFGPCSVEYKTSRTEWKIHHPSGAKRVGASDKWIYPNYEILLDTPVTFGDFKIIVKKVKDVPFYFIFVDQGIGFDSKVDAFVDQVCLASEKIYDVFGLFPFTDYTFILSLNPQADWGLEHLTSNMSGLGPNVFVDDKMYATGIRVCAHELFHAWNVRRLRPAPLGQLRHHLCCGSFTEGLWMAEGFTRYYEFVISTRAKAYTPDQFFSAIAGYYQHLVQQPAYSRVSVTDSSLATYMNHSAYPSGVNNSIDYYDKGMLIAFGLDARLRFSEEESKYNSLDDAFKAFYLKYFGNGETVPADYIGYSTQDAIEFFEDAQCGLGDIIDKQLNQPKNLDTVDQFKAMGFEVIWENTNYIGLYFMNDSAPTIFVVGDTSPAGTAGIAPKDIIQNINGFAYSNSGLKWAAAQTDSITLEVLRGHRKLTFKITPQPFKKMKKLIWKGSESQAKEISSWLNTDKFNPKKGDIFSLDFYDNFHGNLSLV